MYIYIERERERDIDIDMLFMLLLLNLMVITEAIEWATCTTTACMPESNKSTIVLAKQNGYDLIWVCARVVIVAGDSPWKPRKQGHTALK